MNCQRKLKKYVVVIAVLLALPQPQALADSAPPSCPVDSYELSFSSSPTIALKPLDLLVSEKGFATTQQELLASPSFIYNSSTTREISLLWRMRVKTEDVSSLKAKYTLIPTSDKLNPFNNASKAESLGITQSSCPGDNQTTVVEGGVRLTINNLSTIGKGEYFGQLKVCISRQDSNECL
ncbi:hypothetical protein [Scytonema sp. NUACC26]|uniref:hypothetical protein n=1 Tax=Scytonema sp. NUACC26 TaxID=3140176 RepID=UPI0034DBB3E8